MIIHNNPRRVARPEEFTAPGQLLDADSPGADLN